MLKPNTPLVPALREQPPGSPRQSGAPRLRSKRQRTNGNGFVRLSLTIDEELFNLVERAATARGVPSATYMREVLSVQAHIDVAEYAVVLRQGSMRRRRLARLSSPQVQAALSALLDALASPQE